MKFGTTLHREKIYNDKENVRNLFLFTSKLNLIFLF